MSLIDRDQNLLDAVHFKTLDEYQKFRKEKYANALELKDGERRVVVLPGYDFRGTVDHRYGQASPTIIFAERRDSVAIDCSFYLGHNVKGEARIAMDGRDIGFIGIGLYYHRLYKKDVKYIEYSHSEADCPLLGHKRCYGEAGSAIHGGDLQWVFLNRGSEAIWDEIDEAFKEYNR